MRVHMASFWIFVGRGCTDFMATWKLNFPKLVVSPIRPHDTRGSKINPNFDLSVPCPAYRTVHGDGGLAQRGPLISSPRCRPPRGLGFYLGSHRLARFIPRLYYPPQQNEPNLINGNSPAPINERGGSAPLEPPSHLQSSPDTSDPTIGLMRFCSMNPRECFKLIPANCYTE
jgi:hypothetical protein